MEQKINLKKMVKGISETCPTCKNNFRLNDEIEKGNDGSQLVTGCFHCHKSYCD